MKLRIEPVAVLIALLLSAFLMSEAKKEGCNYPSTQIEKPVQE